MDSLAETFEALEDLGADIERELGEAMEKEAKDQGIDYGEMESRELELWKQWKQNPTPETFGPLYAAQAPIIFKAGQRVLSSSPLPKAAVKSFMMRGYIEALHDYNPESGFKLKTFIGKTVPGRAGRYATRYTNIGKIPEKRAPLINLYQNRHAHLLEHLGREPTSDELCDDMNLSRQEVAGLNAKTDKITPRVVSTLKRELRKDLTAESEGPGMGATGFEDSAARDRLIFMHGSLNPDQQLVLEHSFPDWGRPVINDPIELAQTLKMSPQKVRSLRKQIYDKVSKHL